MAVSCRKGLVLYDELGFDELMGAGLGWNAYILFGF